MISIFLLQINVGIYIVDKISIMAYVRKWSNDNCTMGRCTKHKYVTFDIENTIRFPICSMNSSYFFADCEHRFRLHSQVLTCLEWLYSALLNCSLFSFHISACPINSQLPCLHNAEEIFEKYSFSMNNMALDLWAMFLLYIVFNLFGLLFLWKRTKQMC